jgi:selenocysteine lyase/cysteine desulfurase
MSLDRRTFLRHATLAASGFGALQQTRAAEGAGFLVFSERDPESFWQGVKALYPLAAGFTYFNTGGLGPTAQPVLDKAAEVTRQLQLKSEHGHALHEPAREAVARYLGAEAAEIAFVRNASEGNAIVATGLKLAAGDEVVFETHAHPGGSFVWANLERLCGIRVRLFEPDSVDPAGNVARIATLLTKRTRVVQISHVTAPTGIVMPVEAIGRLCRERGVWFHIDGAQSAGMLPFSLHAIGCDSFATSGHKWIGGPLETGVLFVRRERLDEVQPTHVAAYSGELDFLPGSLRLAPTAIRYEYGTRSAAAIVGLAEAMRLQERIGRDRIASRGRELAGLIRAGLAKLPGVEILTPSSVEASGAMVTFRTRQVPQDRLFERLLKDHAIRCRPVTEQKLNALRVSTHVFNTRAECDALVTHVGEILRRA